MDMTLAMQEAQMMLREVLGPHQWDGSDSLVWRSGRYVIKLMQVPRRGWQAMRLLSRRTGPYAPILDMRVIGTVRSGGWGEDKVIGVMVQPYVQQTSTGGDVWWQGDFGASNAVAGLWVDLARVRCADVPMSGQYRRIDMGMQPTAI